jgi:hypothetical protein
MTTQPGTSLELLLDCARDGDREALGCLLERLFRSTEERRSPESCSSFRSSEEPHAGLTTVVLGCPT